MVRFVLALCLALFAAPLAAATELTVPAPGKFVWAAERGGDGPVSIVIGLAEQRAYVFRGDTLIGMSSVSSGKAGAESPIGRFQILEKKRVHRSNRYDDAPMPFMQRLNWYGVALHAGEVTGRPASHGCIRLPTAFARALFAETEVGGSVFVTEDAIAGTEAALTLAKLYANAPFTGPGRLAR